MKQLRLVEKRTGGVARLQRQRVHEKMQVYHISGSTSRVHLRCGREPIDREERGIDVMEHVGPDFSNVLNCWISNHECE